MRLSWGRNRARRASTGPFQVRRIETSNARIEVGSLGAGPPVVLLPGLGGSGTEQYAELGVALSDAGFRVLAINPRGVGRSTGPLENLTLDDLARDVADVITGSGESAHVVGRAFGNRIARVLATNHPELVRSVTLLAAGGLVPPDPAPVRPGSAPARKSSPPNWPEARIAQQRADRHTRVETWWAGGRAPILVIQGLDDRTAVPENGRRLAAGYPERVRLIEIDKAGHRLLTDRPDIVIPEVVAFVTERQRALAANPRSQRESV